MVRSSWPVLFVACLSSAAPAADSWPVPRGPSREPAPVRYDPAMVKALPRDFLDDAAACTLYAGNTYLVEPDGTIETITHDITRLNGRKAIEKLGEYRGITYDPSYQKLTLNEARIHKADGRVAPIEPRHVQLRDVSTDYQVYDHDKQLIISFPSLEVGDTIEVKWTLRGKNPEHGGQFFTRYSFGDLTYPVARDDLRIRLSKDRPFKVAPLNDKIEPTRTSDGANVLYRWQALNLKQPPKDDNLPPRDELRPGVACTTFTSWDEVARWKHRLRADCWNCTEDVRKVVAEVTRGLTDPTAKARALTYWLKRNIRYVSVGEKHDFTPHAPPWVLSNRYGDCKDTSQLLAVMLREAGLAVELVTLGVTDDGQILEAVPSPWGTHAILLVTLDGKEHWIDTTASMTAWNVLPRDDRDRVCYLIDAQGKLRLHRTPRLKPEENRFDQTSHVWIGADGSSRSERTVAANGSAATGQRDLFLEVPSGERRRQAASELQDSNSMTRLVDLVVDEAALRDFDRPTSVRMVYEIANQFSGTTEREGSFSDSKVWGRLLAHNIDYDRQATLVLPAPFESRHRFVVHVHPAFVMDTVPRNKTVHSPWGTFSRKVKVLGENGAGQVLEVDMHTRLEEVRVQPDDFDRFRQFQDEVSKAYRAYLTLRPVQELDQAPVLEALVRLAPEDVACAAALARLYQQNRRHADARRVLQIARHYQPDDAVLWELSVKSAGSTEDEEKAQRELVQRFPEEGRYSLALADVLIHRGKQPEARKLLEPLTKHGAAAQRAQALFYLARSHYRTDELKEALQSLTEAGKVDSDTVHTLRAYQLKGQILEELIRPKDAVAAYLQALTVDPDATHSLDALVRLMLADNKPAEALAYLRRYTTAVGDDPSGLLLAAEHYLRLKRYDEALELAGRVQEERLQDKARRILGLVHLQRGDLVQAAAQLEKASPDAGVMEALIRVQLVLGNLSQAAARLDQADRVDRPTAELRRTMDRCRQLVQRRDQLKKLAVVPAGKELIWEEALGWTVCAEELFRAGQASQAEKLIARALEDGREIGPGLALRGRLFLDHGKLSRALDDAERAIRLAPGQAGGFYVRGRVFLERGQLDAALRDLAKATGASGKTDAEVLHALADALGRAGRVEEALETQRLAVKLKPDDRELREQLDTLEKRKRSGS